MGLGLAFPLAYFAFFGTHISSLTARLSGPIYYIPAYTALSALMAIAIVTLGRRRPALGLGLVAAVLVVTVPFTASRLRVNHDLSEANRPWARSVDQIQGRALVVPSPEGYLLFVNPFGDNGADLDGRILYASDAGPELLELVAEESDRVAYLQRADLSTVDLLPSEHPRTHRVRLTPMAILRGDVHIVGSTSPYGDAAVTVRWWELDEEPLGDATPVPATADLDVALTDLDLPDGLHRLELKVGAGPDLDAARRTPRGRRTFYVRITGGAVELLAPGTAAQVVHRPGTPEPVWEDALSLPELLVDPVADDR